MLALKPLAILRQLALMDPALLGVLDPAIAQTGA
jgi:hypothetical protein